MQTDATRLTSDELLTRPIGGCKRALYKSMGFDDEDLSRPLIGLANAWSELVPALLGTVESDLVKAQRSVRWARSRERDPA